jgi:hypothetical protein
MAFLCRPMVRVACAVLTASVKGAGARFVFIPGASAMTLVQRSAALVDMDADDSSSHPVSPSDWHTAWGSWSQPRARGAKRVVGICVGVQKAGTAMYERMIAQRPEVCPGKSEWG